MGSTEVINNSDFRRKQYFKILFVLFTFCLYVSTASIQFNILRIRGPCFWLSIDNRIFEFNIQDTSIAPKHILTWFPRENCHRSHLSCLGHITHTTEIEAGLFEICGVMQGKAFCGLYSASAQGVLSPVSEKRIADEIVNRGLEPSYMQHSDDTLVILKRQQEENQPPLLILRRGYSQNMSALHQPGANPNWWRTQIFSRNFQLPQGQQYELAHQCMHQKYHYLFFNRMQAFHNPLDEFFLPQKRTVNMQSPLVVRFCLNDGGFQMPDNGLAVFTTLHKVRLSCNVHLPQAHALTSFYSKNRFQKLNDAVAFDYIAVSSSFIGPDNELHYVGLFEPKFTQNPLQRLQDSAKMVNAPLALCLFRASDLNNALKHSSMAVQMNNSPTKRLVEINRVKDGCKDDSGRFVLFNKSKDLTDLLQCKIPNSHVGIKGSFLQEPWSPMNKDGALALLQTRNRFIAMLVDRAENVPDSPRRNLIQGRELCLLYLLTESFQLMVFLAMKRDLFRDQESTGSKGSNPPPRFKDLAITGGLEMLFAVELTPAFSSKNIKMELFNSRNILVSDSHRLAIVDPKACFTALFHKRSGFAMTKYLSVDKDSDLSDTEVFRWRVFQLKCQFNDGHPLTNASLPPLSNHTTTPKTPVKISSSLTTENKKSPLLPIVWTLAILASFLSVVCTLLICALLRLRTSYTQKRRDLQEFGGMNSNEIYHSNRFQDQELLSEENNLLQGSVLTESGLQFTGQMIVNPRTSPMEPMEVVTNSEDIQKIRVYPTVTCIPLNLPSLPTRHRQLNNDLELRTFTIEPIITRI